MTDIVELIKIWAADLDAPVPPVIPTEYALIASDEIERLRAECQKLANYLMHGLVFVHEHIIEEVDVSLEPYLGG